MNETQLLIRRADSIWSRLICHKFKGRCMVCGRPGDDSHHWAFSRSIRGYRWVILNGIYLCRQDHQWAEENKAEFRRIVGMNCPERWAWYLEQEPLTVEPFHACKIQGQYDSLKAEALRVGLKIKEG
jgi:hypothetical protein